MLKNSGVLTLILLLLFSSDLLLLAGEIKIGDTAPMLTGKNIKSDGLLHLKRLMQKIEREKDDDGNYVLKNNKYSWVVEKNIVVLNFFATTCVPCVKEIPTFEKVAEKFKSNRVKLIYINVDAEITNSEMLKFITRRGIKLPMMLPNQREAVKKYNVYTLPRLVVVDKNQKIAKIIKGFDKNLEKQLSSEIDRLLKKP